MHYEPQATSVGDFLITARSLAEYRAMFALTDADLRGRILDCPGGASSFTAEANALGAQAIAVDPAYGMPIDKLAEHATAETERGTAWADATSSRYVWDFYGDLAGHQRVRRTAAARFVDDLRLHPDRYLPEQLPSLTFPDNAFDLVLSSHLLFTYADRLDFGFHLAALSELSRVSAGRSNLPTGRSVRKPPNLADVRTANSIGRERNSIEDHRRGLRVSTWFTVDARAAGLNQNSDISRCGT